ncbi:hypothetical protein CS546_08945 [Porphyromonas gingivalis]|nr:hypothetical protein CS546_08945 [Porphyromonas gingivalis]ATR96391.1 hypothetical protein CS548_04425 [Porphyromonas gingivalis]
MRFAETYMKHSSLRQINACVCLDQYEGGGLLRKGLVTIKRDESYCPYYVLPGSIKKKRAYVENIFPAYALPFYLVVEFS